MASLVSRAGVSFVFSALGMAAGVSFGAYLVMTKAFAGTSRLTLLNVALHVGAGAVIGLLGAQVLFICLF